MNTQYWCRDCEIDWEFLELELFKDHPQTPTVNFCPHCGMRLVNEERPELAPESSAGGNPL